MIEFIISSIITSISMLVGYSLGRWNSPTPPNIQRKIDKIFHKVVSSAPTLPGDEIGPIQRPTATQNYYRDNPKQAEEDRLMLEEIQRQQANHNEI